LAGINKLEQINKNSMAFGLQANYTDWAAATCRRS
jgi:hypothetical protein